MYKKGTLNGKADALTRMPGDIPSKGGTDSSQNTTILGPNKWETERTPEDNRITQGNSWGDTITAPRTNPPDTFHWTFCFDNNCVTHQSDKAGSNYRQKLEAITAETQKDPETEINQAMEEDEVIQQTIQDIKAGTTVSKNTALGLCKIENGFLTYEDKIWIPDNPKIRIEILQTNHDNIRQDIKEWQKHMRRYQGITIGLI